MKRLLDCRASDFVNMTKPELLYAIRASEGRGLVSETIGIKEPVLGDITNAEFAASQGADMLLLNIFDVINPLVKGLPVGTQPQETIRTIKRLTGRTVGINLEPFDPSFNIEKNNPWALTPGRLATVENAIRAVDMGVNFIVLTGNPGNGVSSTGYKCCGWQ
jgi:hypothetical protein